MSAAVAAPPAARRRVPLYALVAASAVSLTGNMVTLVALPIYVLTETGSAARTGLVGAFAFAPMVIGGALGGVVVDRIGPRRASVLADAVSGATMLAIPLCALAGALPLWLLLGLVFASGVLDSPGQSARMVLVPEAAALAGVPVERGVALMGAVERGARLVGAPLAGLLVGLLGGVNALFVDAATFAVSALIVGLLVPRALRPAAEADHTPGQGYWQDFRAGLRFVARDPLLRAIVLMVVVTNVFDAAKVSVLLPVVAEDRLGGAAAFGLLVGALGGGALVGSLAFAAVGHRLPRRVTLVAAFLTCGPAPLLALATGWPLPVLLGVYLVCGLGAGLINPILETAELRRVPPALRARVVGATTAGCWAAMPLGALGAGVAVTAFGTTPVLVAVGVAYLLASLAPLVGRGWDEIDR
ncbi:putative multidrug-efflux transporter [Pilimelia terevasa]|uniref:Multidrug efflux pump Tap n=1 Tax=Pilimelia terevasa TaxID=53372 RepID=A0A8J3FEA6_9ACTN|nr:MFS transporter [Pilimelia terevasa]GGK14861.1 putative multidrug-efflux transporter [Pilimelia terevasa]